MSREITRRGNLIRKGLMLTVFELAPWSEKDERPVSAWIAALLFAIVNDNPYHELGSREQSRHIETFDLELRKGLNKIVSGDKTFYELKHEGYKFAVEKAVALTVREAANKLLPKLTPVMASRRNATEDFLNSLKDISVDEWKNYNAE